MKVTRKHLRNLISEVSRLHEYDQPDRTTEDWPRPEEDYDDGYDDGLLGRTRDDARSDQYHMGYDDATDSLGNTGE